MRCTALPQAPAPSDPAAALQVATAVSLVRNEGVLALYSGLGPAVLRGLTYGGAPACWSSAKHFRRTFKRAFPYLAKLALQACASERTAP